VVWEVEFTDDVYIPIADKLYDEHLQQIKNEYKAKEVQ